MRIGPCCFLVLTILVATPLPADTLHLTNGDTLTGVVTAQTDDTVTLDHAVLGPVTVPMAQVASITLDAPDTADQADESTPTDGDDETADAPPGTPALASTPKGGGYVEPERRGLFATSFLAGWDNSLAIGVTGSSGNSDTLSINAQFKTAFEDENDRWLWNNTYFLSEDDGEKSRNEFKSELTKDWLIPGSPWFYFANGIYEYDQFQAWKHRASAFGGIGYTFIKTEKLELNGRLGAGFTKQFSGDRDFTPEALVGSSLVKYHITPQQNLTAGITIYPSLGDAGEFRAIATAEYQIEIDNADGLSLKLGLENEYESEVAEDTKHNDLKYYGALVYDF